MSQSETKRTKEQKQLQLASMFIWVISKRLTKEEFEKEWGDANGFLPDIARPKIDDVNTLILMSRQILKDIEEIEADK